MRGVILFIAFLFSAALHVFAAEAVALPQASREGPGIRENLGGIIPADIEVIDESGVKVSIGSLIERPVVLTLAYYRCTKFCTDIRAGLASAVDRLGSVAGKDFDLLTVSFDERDTPSGADKKRRDLALLLKRPIAHGSWRFLTADAPNIGRLAGAVGFGYERQADGFIHPAALVVISPKGRVIRYLYGLTVLPRDLDLAIAEASAERTGPTIPKTLLFCYRFDSSKKGYVLDWMKLSGITILGCAAIFFIYAARRKVGR
ncbi:MAG: SCO family protein [Deltaproteobacteria bacterium]